MSAANPNLGRTAAIWKQYAVAAGDVEVNYSRSMRLNWWRASLPCSLKTLTNQIYKLLHHNNVVAIAQFPAIVVGPHIVDDIVIEVFSTEVVTAGTGMAARIAAGQKGVAKTAPPLLVRNCRRFIRSMDIVEQTP